MRPRRSRAPRQPGEAELALPAFGGFHSALALMDRDDITVEKAIGVYRGPRIYRFDGFDVLPAEEFLNRLHRGEIF